MAAALTIFVSFLVFMQAYAASNFPDKIRICRRNHLDRLNECLVRAIMELRPEIAKGVPELQLPPMDPHALDPLEFIQTDGGVRVRALYDKLIVHGLSQFELKYFDWHFPQKKMFVGLVFPSLLVKGFYNITGRILALPIDGNGPYTSLLKGVVIESEGNLGLENSKTYLKDFSLDFEIHDSEAKMDNLFNGNQILSETMHHFLKENNQMIANEIKPALQIQFSNLLGAILKSLIRALPSDVVDSKDMDIANSNDRHRKRTIEIQAAKKQGGK